MKLNHILFSAASPFDPGEQYTASSLLPATQQSNLRCMQRPSNVAAPCGTSNPIRVMIKQDSSKFLQLKVLFHPPVQRGRSYIKVRNISLGYNFTSKQLKNTGLSNLKVYVQAMNPFSIYIACDWLDTDLLVKL